MNQQKEPAPVGDRHSSLPKEWGLGQRGARWGLGVDGDVEASILPFPHIPRVALRVSLCNKHFLKQWGSEKVGGMR